MADGDGQIGRRNLEHVLRTKFEEPGRQDKVEGDWLVYQLKYQLSYPLKGSNDMEYAAILYPIIYISHVILLRSTVVCFYHGV